MKRITLFLITVLFLSVTAAQSSTQLDLEIKNSEPTPLQTSEYADVWLELSNVGDADAENVDVTFLGDYPFTVERGDRSNWSIGEINAGDSYLIHLKTRVDGNAVQGNNTMNFRVSQGDFSVVEKVPVEVRSDRNVLAVESIDFPGKVVPGSSNKMQLELKNLADSQLKNIQVTLDLSDDLPLATAESSKKNIVSIGSDESEKINYTVNIDSSAENGVYKLPIETSFENEAGTEFEQSTKTGVWVGGEPNLEADLNTDKTLKDGITEEITFRLVNRGHGSADFVSMKLEETDSIEVIGSNEVYIGSMDPDDFQTASFKINVDAEMESVNLDNLQMPVRLEYTDSGVQKSDTQDVEAEIYTENELQQYGLTSTSYAIPIAIVTVLAILAGLYYWRRKRKKE